LSSRKIKLLHVAGTRPNFMKVAPVMRAVEAWNASVADAGFGSLGAARLRFQQLLVHTGQHYDAAMSQVFMDDLALPEPAHFLGAGAAATGATNAAGASGTGSHAAQTGRVMVAFERVLRREAPDMVVVVGDVNSTLAAALVCAKLQVPLAHVEAGLRSRDRTMPEEVNRVLTDQVADLLLTTCEEAGDNLRAEGIDSSRIRFVGNTMIDSLDRCLPTAQRSAVLDRLGLAPRGYCAVTFHRPSNVDDADSLKRLVDLLLWIADRMPVVYPVHPRTRERLTATGLDSHLTPGHRDLCHGSGRILLTEPLGYLDFLRLESMGRLVITDSGGIQEETTVLGVPCITLRTTTERPITISEGTNHLVDPADADAVLQVVERILDREEDYVPRRPVLWDGHAGERVVQAIAEWFTRGGVDRERSLR
jgi:UDP-N-acetylglucosamine 2-epimerase (non-hydrolysing)